MIGKTVSITKPSDPTILWAVWRRTGEDTARSWHFYDDGSLIFTTEHQRGDREPPAPFALWENNDQGGSA